jgi:hypothetical protein
MSTRSTDSHRPDDPLPITRGEFRECSECVGALVWFPVEWIEAGIVPLCAYCAFEMSESLVLDNKEVLKSVYLTTVDSGVTEPVVMILDLRHDLETRAFAAAYMGWCQVNAMVERCRREHIRPVVTAIARLDQLQGISSECPGLDLTPPTGYFRVVASMGGYNRVAHMPSERAEEHGR